MTIEVTNPALFRGTHPGVIPNSLAGNWGLWSSVEGEICLVEGGSAHEVCTEL